MQKEDEMFSYFSPTVFTRRKNSKLYKLLKSFAEQFDSVEDALDFLKKSFQIDDASGKDLEKIAKLFDLYRTTGETDNSLRARIIAYWTGALGCGTLESIKQALQQFDENLDIEEIDVLKCRIFGEVKHTLINQIDDVVKKTKPVGISIFKDITTAFDKENINITDKEFVKLLMLSYFKIESHKIESQNRVDAL